LERFRQGCELIDLDPSQPPSAKSRDFLLRIGSRYIGVLALLLHVPTLFAIDRMYWTITVLPSVVIGTTYFLVAPVFGRSGALAAAALFVSTGICQVTLLTLCLGAASGLHYYYFAIAAAAIYLFHGFQRTWLLASVLPMLLFLALTPTVGEQGLVVSIPSATARWLSTGHAIGAFAIIGVIGFLFSRATDEAERLLSAEKDRSERLLLNILPEPIANRLKSGTEKVIADRIDEVSVMFADLVGFTLYARDREPAAVVSVLNALFSRFDARVDALGLEKIKTIGDAYMVLAGAPTIRPDHLTALADLALELVQEVHAFRDPDGHRFAVRIGLHVGPVVTGVIGTRKMAYDVWGDTVNVASRLESTGLPQRIQVSAIVAERLADRFVFEARGTTEIKGVGAMETFFLTGRKSS
jgi:adenylate cyclase